LRIGIIGAGFAGLGAAIRLQQAGFTDLTVFERAAELGGTWRDNTYPGCACDIPSVLYSYSFAPNPEWTRLYPSQGEIWAYLRRVADTYGLRRRIRFGADLGAARWDEASGTWRLAFKDGSEATVDILISASGFLNKPALPRIEGLDAFQGPAFHSSQWRHDVDLAGKRVALVGTGASAIQILPEIAKSAAQVFVFQRTPPWVLPRMDRALSARERRWYRRLPFLQRLARWRIYLRQELLFTGFLGGAWIQKRFRKYAAGLLERQVPDAELRAKLTPAYAPGCKRLLVSNDWYPALQQANVELLAEPVARLEGQRIVGASGAAREVDAVVFATGFIATEFVAPVKVHGRGGVELGALWKNGAASHLGISVAGFPNAFFLVGPNTGLGHNSILFMIEAQMNYIVGALKTGARVLELLPEVQSRSYDSVQRRMKKTVWASGCRSWYLTADGRNDTLWPGSTLEYWLRTLRFDDGSYRVS
jgi:cation diffusion facilitator CzcD-associated flavoprotein CzcO